MYRNNEHYPDPTCASAYAAIKKEIAQNQGETYMPWVYIASPLRGDIEGNIKRAKEYCHFAIKQNAVPMCPHIYFPLFFDDNAELERRIGLILGLQMLKRCKEMWVFGDRISKGMANEIKIAEKRKIPVRYFTSECVEVNTL